MSSSTLISNYVTARDDVSRRKKRKKIVNQNPAQTSIEWKFELQQQIYSSKLLQALRHVRLSSSPRRGRAVREAADRVLAATAKGRTRWSRAILTSRLKLKFMKNRRARARATVMAGNRPKKPPRVSILRLKSKNLPAVQRKIRFLGRLVPGCKKEALPVILEEATDYIAALQMQIKAMSSLAEMLSASTELGQIRLPPP